LVWKNTLNESGTALPDGYWNNWQGMLDEGFTNSISLRALYFLDYSFIESRLKR
jgi:hypothetical protein